MVPPSVRPKRVPIAPYTTLGVGGEVELWEAGSVADLRVATREPYRILGAGSNLLVSDAGVPERVVKLGRAFNSLPRFTASADLWLGAATPLPGLVRRTADAGLSGLEGLLGIPAVLGGAVAMNAGTRFGELSDTLQEVEIFLNGSLHRLPANSLGLGYRRSKLPEGAVVTRVRLSLTPASPERVEALLAKVNAARAGQPKVRSAGCAFKNPPGDAAGRLIDVHGLKGLRVGGAMISHEHGNFVVNLGGAKADDVVRLLKEVRSRVDVPLQVEWRLWGFERGLEEEPCAAP